MYTINEVQRLQLDSDFFKSEQEKYCLVALTGKDLTFQDVQNHCNFAILIIINDLKKGLLSPNTANNLINQIETFEYAKDMLGAEKVIFKINKEIIEDYLHTPHFHQLAVVCSDLYDFD